MIRVIKNGRYKRLVDLTKVECRDGACAVKKINDKVKCPLCDCVFQYGKEDLDAAIHINNNNIIDCPWCKGLVLIN